MSQVSVLTVASFNPGVCVGVGVCNPAVSVCVFLQASPGSAPDAGPPSVS